MTVKDSPLNRGVILPQNFIGDIALYCASGISIINNGIAIKNMHEKYGIKNAPV